MAAMLEETATVTQADGEWLWLETEPKSACSHCNASGCSTSVIGKAFGNRRNRMRLPNTLGALPGQQVVIGIPEPVLVGASLRAYLLPLVVMLTAGWLAVAAGLGEVLQALFIMGGLIIGLRMAGSMVGRPAVSGRYQPRLLRVLPGTVVPVEFASRRGNES